MPRPEAFLVDVYETILTCDFEGFSNELPVMAGVPAQAWHASLTRLGPALTDGRLSMAQAYEQTLQSCGVQPWPGLVRELVRRDAELLLASARLFDDAIPFLDMLRSRGVKIAIVSNCTENTRPLLAELRVSELADALVLSCEAGWAKPAAGIYQRALDQLGVDAGDAAFIDDQAAYCAGAAALGIRALQIVRGDLHWPDPHWSDPPDGATVVSSLLEAGALL